MITEQDLKAAIAECQGVMNPNANTCIKLASFMTIYDHMFKEENNLDPTAPLSSYSYDDNVLNVHGNSEFLGVVNGKDKNSVFNVLDELMQTLQILNPRLYDSVILKIQEAG